MFQARADEEVPVQSFHKTMIDRYNQEERKYIESRLSIMTPSGNVSKFKFNHVQELYEERKSKFDYILKARKMGISTRIIASDIFACAHRKNTNAVLLTHTDDATQKMMRDRIMPMLKSNTSGIIYKARSDSIDFPQTNSSYYVGTAGSRRFGRGDDITRYHLTELAHYSDPDVLTGVEEACLENAIGRIETTANGDNFAKKLWDESKAGRTRYKPIFFPWYCDPRYSMTTDYDLPRQLTEKESELVNTIGLTLRQIAWRREKIRQMSRPELFPQEYPETDMEAFISSGKSVFDWLSLVKQERGCRKPSWVGRIRQINDRYDFEVKEHGELSMWESPKNGSRYVIGADVAEGIDGGAYSAAFVLDLHTMCQVAEWWGHIAPDLFAQTLIDLSIYYNRAWLAPESWPGPGETTTSHIIDLGYNRLFQFPSEDRPGWHTTAQSKQRMIYETGAALRDCKMQVRSHDLISEYRSYIYDSGKHMVPSPGTYSDRVIASCIAYMISENTEAIQQTLKTSSIMSYNEVATVPQWSGPRPGVREE